MSSVTAQILIGDGHQNHDGIIPLHQMFLSENSRPSWTLTCLDEASAEPPVTWIPSIEHMLEDGLLMIGLYLLKDEGLRALAGDVIETSDDEHIEMYRDFSEEQRKELYAACCQIKGCKIVLTVLKGSAIRDQCGILKDYGIEVELCVSS